MITALARGSEALSRLLEYEDIDTIVDVGSGEGLHAKYMREAGKNVTTVSLADGADHVGDFMVWYPTHAYDAIWACHVLEHQPDPNAFLKKCWRTLRPGGVLAVTVPPLKREIVGGHVTLWNAGLLLYQLILAGFDCKNARVGTYGYNISVIVRKEPSDLPELAYDEGDIERLAKFFPIPVSQGFNGELANVNWGDDDVARPRHVTIVGLGPSAEGFMDLAKRLGGRWKYCDEVWTINALGDVLACDLVFHMDDVRIQQIRADAKPDSNIAAMLEWMKTSKVPIMTSRSHPDYPALLEFPLEAVLNKYPQGYMNSTAAYAVAFALHIGVRKLTLFGCDFTYPNAHDAEKGRACMEFWLGIAAAQGVELAMPKTTTLMDAMHPQQERFYGYDCVELGITRNDDGVIEVGFTPRETLPTAEEIEHAYDHSRHPNPLAEASS